MQRVIRGSVVGIVLGALSAAGGAAVAQPARGGPAPTPAAAPAVDPPKRIELPPGFQKVTDGPFAVICEPNEVAWVKAALADAAKKAKKPEGGPADMVKKFADKRALLVDNMVKDLALPDARGVNDLLDTKVIPTLQRLDTLKVPIYYIVTTNDKLKAVVQSGWDYNKRFHYNKLADAVAINQELSLSTDKPMDDQVRVLFFDPKNMDVKKNTEGLTNQLVAEDQQIQVGVARQAFPQAFTAIAEWIDKTVFEPMKLPRNQRWAQLGIPNYLTTKYAAQVTGLPRDQYLANFFQEADDVPVRAMSIDLSKPIEEKDLNPAIKPYYEMAMLRKSVAVTKKVADDTNDTALGKLIVVLRKGAPAGDAGLIKTLKEATGVDLGGPK